MKTKRIKMRELLNAFIIGLLVYWATDKMLYMIYIANKKCKKE